MGMVRVLVVMAMMMCRHRYVCPRRRSRLSKGLLRDLVEGLPKVLLNTVERETDHSPSPLWLCLRFPLCARPIRLDGLYHTKPSLITRGNR